MTRIPVVVDDPSPYLSTNSTRPKAGWIAIALATACLIVTVVQIIFSIKHRAKVASTLIFASSLQCISLVEFAYSSSYPLSTSWMAAGAVFSWMAGPVLTFYCTQIFGRAARAGSMSNPGHSKPLRGFVRCNTTIFGLLVFVAWLIVATGSAVVTIGAPQGQVDSGNLPVVTAGQGVMKAGLVLQLVVLLSLVLIVWRFRVISTHWNVDWDARRRFTWTWKRLITIILSSIGLLLLGQIYHVARFFANSNEKPWLALIFDAFPSLGILVVLTIFHPGLCLPPSLLNITARHAGVEEVVEIEMVKSSKASSPKSVHFQ
ncbi:uncharacterized protein AB675_4683 [Cyphellophora attinorum]|uniref:Sphingoid long-chain base transporter RSB1 n=1 Tax=Cyphellophora attinorum TaxID=1664694 RepID=A0A0N1H7L3_9EURO|nr:uncharacterized protein AB675_4683 [Phialophora attinorum]KPI39037.1 hypothetical protein AB675_4683 [Phialophora attinorum]